MERDITELALYLRTQLKEKDLPNKAEVVSFIKNARKYFSAKDIGNEVLITTKQLLMLADQPTSRPSVCSHVIIFTFGKVINEAALREIQIGNKKRFSMLYDYANGIVSPMETILGAEAHIQNKNFTPDNISEAASALRMNIAEEADAFLTMNSIYRGAAELLKQDPTGVKLLETPLQFAENDALMSYQDQIVIAGARHAVDVYKEIYPKTENL